MKKSVLESAPSCARVLPLVFAVAAVSNACAEGSIDDSHAKIEARNVYFNQDNRSGPAQPSKLEGWGQGFILNFTSGYTQGPVGFGVDALGMLGIRLDSGRGVQWRNAMLRSTVATQRDLDENRLYVTYTHALF